MGLKLTTLVVLPMYKVQRPVPLTEKLEKKFWAAFSIHSVVHSIQATCMGKMNFASFNETFQGHQKKKGKERKAKIATN